MEKVVVGLDMHLKKTEGVVMAMDGAIVKRERFETSKENLRNFLRGLPPGTIVAGIGVRGGGPKVALESVGFCWPWIDFIESLGYEPLLANPIKVKSRAEDVKTDKADSELLAHLLRMDWLPTVYVPSKELRALRNLLRHRAFRRKIATAFKNRTWSELRKRDVQIDANLSTCRGRERVASSSIYEVAQNVEVIELIENQIKRIEMKLKIHYRKIKPVKLLQTIPGIGFLTALTLVAHHPNPFTYHIRVCRDLRY